MIVVLRAHAEDVLVVHTSIFLPTDNSGDPKDLCCTPGHMCPEATPSQLPGEPTVKPRPAGLLGLIGAGGPQVEQDVS